MSNWPLSWFFNGKLEYIDGNLFKDFVHEDEDEEPETRVDWRNLEYLGWSAIYLSDINYYEIPEKPCIYVVGHEYEKPALYVGQSKNLKKRIKKNSHHKISEIINLYESAPTGYHNKGDASMDIRIIWKEIPTVNYQASVERNLIWCEAIAIGLLCPLMQGSINDVRQQEWAYGMDWYV